MAAIIAAISDKSLDGSMEFRVMRLFIPESSDALGLPTIRELVMLSFISEGLSPEAYRFIIVDGIPADESAYLYEAMDDTDPEQALSVLEAWVKKQDRPLSMRPLGSGFNPLMN